MARASPPFAGLEGRGKLHLVGADLSHLGVSPDRIGALPLIEPLAFLGDEAAMIGAMYVLEGSILGGQVVARQVERVLGAAVAENACAYFKGSGKAATMPTWRAFWNASATWMPDLTMMSSSARRTFDVLRRWLTR